jgi:GTP-binding protein
VNKADKPADQIEALKYIKLGLGEPLPVSAKNGRGLDGLLERIKNFYPASAGAKKSFSSSSPKPPLKRRRSLNLAIIGKPNVGKSSLFNALLQEERVVVSPIPHTTRDPNDTEITYQNHIINLIDTAGLRKKARIYKGAPAKRGNNLAKGGSRAGRGDKIEIFSIKKTLDIIKKADIALLLIDASLGITTQDLKISKLLKDSSCGLIIVANKWDKVQDKNVSSLQKIREYFYSRLKSLNWAPLIFSDVKHPSKGRIFGLEENYMARGSSSCLSAAELRVSEANPDEAKRRSLRQAKASDEPHKPANPMHKLLDLSLAINQNQNQQIPEEELKTALLQALKAQPPPRPRRNKPRPKIIDWKQVDTTPPTFLLTLPPKVSLPNHYLGYLKNQLRKKFNLWGTVINLKCQISNVKN